MILKCRFGEPLMETKENQRIALTKRLVRETLIILLRTTDLSRISIRELCEKAGINRTTFYNHYGSQYDVLMELSRNYLNDIESALTSATVTDREEVHKRVAFVFHYIEEHLEVSRILINSSLDPDFPVKLFSIPKISALFEEQLPIDMDQAVKKAAFTYAVSGSYSLIREWINKDPRCSADEEAELVLTLSGKICK